MLVASTRHTVTQSEQQWLPLVSRFLISSIEANLFRIWQKAPRSWNEFQVVSSQLYSLHEAMEMLKAAEKMRSRIQRIELENSNVTVTTEKQAREMDAPGEELLSAGVDVVDAALEQTPGETREDAAAMPSHSGLMKRAAELSKMRMQDDSYKVEVEKYKKLYLKELRSNNALLSLLQNRPCQSPERSSANLEEELQWSTSAVVALGGPHPQMAHLTRSSMEPQGNVPHTPKGPEAGYEFPETPRSWSEDRKRVKRELVDSVRSLLCALHREARRTKELETELTEMKKIFNMPPKKGHGCEGKGHRLHEVSKASQAEMRVPVTMLRLEGEAATEENLVCIRENPSASLTQMKLEMKKIESAIAEVNTQEYLVKKELEVIKQLYRAELAQIDSMSLEMIFPGIEIIAISFTSKLECNTQSQRRAHFEPFSRQVTYFYEKEEPLDGSSQGGEGTGDSLRCSEWQSDAEADVTGNCKLQLIEILIGAEYSGLATFWGLEELSEMGTDVVDHLSRAVATVLCDPELRADLYLLLFWT
ncbi:uncharacterized protein LOC127193617 [Acomys russatus]|uniref:uncharacterized protein LOC127193617 n=1 Tax=Acomys russatus TaxID=60746 RepID=UPI0021E227F9|nr:uncharacterized protein LOC127193617 [Acomys russatus]